MAELPDWEIPSEGVEFVLLGLNGQETASTDVDSNSQDDKTYKVSMFLTCECKSFMYRRWCTHIDEVMRQPDQHWTVRQDILDRQKRKR